MSGRGEPYVVDFGHDRIVRYRRIVPGYVTTTQRVGSALINLALYGSE